MTTTHATPENEQAWREPGSLNDDAKPFSAPARPLSSPRAHRLLLSLMGGPVSREALDRLIGASNSPDVVFRLRQRGFDIPCERIQATDRDGRACMYGRYRLTPDDARKAAAVLAGGRAS